MDYKNLSKLAITLSSIALLLIFYLLSNAPQEQTDLSNRLERMNLELHKIQRAYEHLAQELDELESSTRDVRFNHIFNEYEEMTDFTTPNVQDIGDGFMIVKPSQEEHLDGIKFQGRIINAQSVTHQSLTFNLTVSDRSKEFNVSRVSPGNSTSFSVYIPDIKAKDARRAKVEYVGSSVRYFTR